MGERTRGQSGAREHYEVDFFDMVRLMGDRLTDSLHAVETLALDIAYNVAHDAQRSDVEYMTHDLVTAALTAQIHSTAMHDCINERMHGEEDDLGLDQRLMLRTIEGGAKEVEIVIGSRGSKNTKGRRKKKKGSRVQSTKISNHASNGRKMAAAVRMEKVGDIVAVPVLKNEEHLEKWGDEVHSLWKAYGRTEVAMARIRDGIDKATEGVPRVQKAFRKMEADNLVPATDAYVSPAGVQHPAEAQTEYNAEECTDGTYYYGVELHQLIKAVITQFPNDRAKDKARATYRCNKQLKQLLAKWLPEMEKLIRAAGKDLDNIELIEDIIELMSLTNVRACPPHLAPMRDFCHKALKDGKITDWASLENVAYDHEADLQGALGVRNSGSEVYSAEGVVGAVDATGGDSRVQEIPEKKLVAPIEKSATAVKQEELEGRLRITEKKLEAMEVSVTELKSEVTGVRQEVANIGTGQQAMEQRLLDAIAAAAAQAATPSQQSQQPSQNGWNQPPGFWMPPQQQQGGWQQQQQRTQYGRNPVPPGSRFAQDGRPICNHCQEAGHTRPQCPNRHLPAVAAPASNAGVGVRKHHRKGSPGGTEVS